MSYETIQILTYEVHEDYFTKDGLHVVCAYPGLGKTKGAWSKALRSDRLILYVAPLRALVKAQNSRDFRGRTVVQYSSDNTWRMLLHPSSTATNYVVLVTAYQLAHLHSTGIRTDITVIIDEVTLMFNMLSMAPFLFDRVKKVLDTLEYIVQEGVEVFILDAFFPLCVGRWLHARERYYYRYVVLPYYIAPVRSDAPIKDIAYLKEGEWWRYAGEPIRLEYYNAEGELCYGEVMDYEQANRPLIEELQYNAIRRYHTKANALATIKFRVKREAKITCDIDNWFRRLKRDIRSNKKIFICCSSATKAKGLREVLIKDNPDTSIFVACAHDIRDLEDDDTDFDIVREVERDVHRVVIATGCIWTGVSLESNTWDKVYGLYDDRGGSILDLFQGLCRVRCLLNAQSDICILNEYLLDTTIDDIIEKTKVDIIKKYSRIGQRYIPDALIHGEMGRNGYAVDWNDIYCSIILFFQQLQRSSITIPYKTMQLVEKSYFLDIVAVNLDVDIDASKIAKMGITRRGRSLQERLDYYDRQEYNDQLNIHNLNPLSRFLRSSGLATPSYWIEAAKRLLPHTGPSTPLWSATLHYIYLALKASNANLDEVHDVYSILERGGEPCTLPYPNTDYPPFMPIVVDSEIYRVVVGFLGARTLYAHRVLYLFKLAHYIYSNEPDRITDQYLEDSADYLLYENPDLYTDAYHWSSPLPEPIEAEPNQHKKKQRWFARIFTTFTNRLCIFHTRRVVKEDEEIRELAGLLRAATPIRKAVHW